MRIMIIFLLYFTNQLFSQTFTQEMPQLKWMNNKSGLLQFRDYLDESIELGLKRSDYNINFIDSLINDDVRLTSFTDSAEADSTITQIAITFFSDIVYGTRPVITYNGINYDPDCMPLSDIVMKAVLNHSLVTLLDSLESKAPEYVSLKIRLANLADTLSLTRRDDKKRILALESKITSVIRALNTVRWMNCLTSRNEFVILVNVPSANLLLYNNGKIIFESKVIVGTRSTRTPLFVSNLTDVTIYPYWNVPKSIAVKELLPMIKKDINYLENNNFQILNTNGKVIDPYGVDWRNLTAANFPYSIRQSTGCDNSLGLIKLNINHPNNIYLHDTPWKILFESAKRFYSHGCIRVEKAKDLAHIILKENSVAVDTLKESENTARHRPVVIKLNQDIPVLVLYNTTWFNADGTVRYYSDIYSKFK
jgi:L,D-transpeptidase YcbB